MVKVTGKTLIVFGILGIIAVIIYKIINNTMPYIGPKSSIALIICGILIAIGILSLLRARKKLIKSS